MNYAFTAGNALPSVKNGHTFEYLNFTRMKPHTKIFKGVTGLIFKKCNLTNCDLPADAVVIDSPNRHRDFCTNLRPRLIDKGVTPCTEKCSHVVGTDVISVDGVIVQGVYHYEDTTEPI